MQATLVVESPGRNRPRQGPQKTEANQGSAGPYVSRKEIHERETGRKRERERGRDIYIYFCFLFIYYLICCPETEPDPTLALSEIPDAAPLLPFHGLLDILRSPLPVRLLFRLPLLLGRKVRNGVLGVLVPEVRRSSGPHLVYTVSSSSQSVRGRFGGALHLGGPVEAASGLSSTGSVEAAAGWSVEAAPGSSLVAAAALSGVSTKPLSGPWGVGGALGTVQAGGGGGKDPKVPCPGP